MFWSWNGAPSSCPAIFRRAAPPVSARRFFVRSLRLTAVDSAAWVRSRASGVHGGPAASVSSSSFRSWSAHGDRRLCGRSSATLDPGAREAVRESPRGIEKTVGGGVLVGVSVERSCPNTRQLTIGAPSRAPDGHACTAAASGTVRDFRGDWRDKHEAPSTSGLDGPVCSCVERGVHRGKTMYRCSGKCLTVNPLRHLCDSHGSNGRPGRHFGRRRSTARSRGAGLWACV